MQSQPTKQCRTLHSALLGSLGGFISLHFPQTCLRKRQWVHFGKSSLGAAYCTGFQQSSHPGAQRGCSRQQSRLALLYAVALLAQEQSKASVQIHFSTLAAIICRQAWLVILFSCCTSSGKERVKSFQTTILGKT